LPFTIAELPEIDIVVISHAHYDHLDLSSLRELEKKGQGRTKFFVALGDKKLLESQGIQNVQEFDWWDQVQVQQVQFTFTPAQHWTQRSLFLRNKTLWGGWHIKEAQWSFLYTGDTGYSKDFKDIYQRLGKVDVAMIPIGAYEPRWFMKKQHVNPDEALMIHQDLIKSFDILMQLVLLIHRSFYEYKLSQLVVLIGGNVWTNRCKK
jgi:L-ascorbate metabolism protein UlaG (beta-lactamase superfamily)